jgi:hypothetical protein
MRLIPSGARSLKGEVSSADAAGPQSASQRHGRQGERRGVPGSREEPGPTS